MNRIIKSFPLLVVTGTAFQLQRQLIPNVLSKSLRCDLSSVINTETLNNTPEIGAKGHIQLSHTLLDQILHHGDSVIDATCGNGHDSIFLAKRIFNGDSGHLHCIDIQDLAIESTKAKLSAILTPKSLSRVTYHRCSHSTFPEEIKESTITAIVYNLGYLPGSDKKVKTQLSTTLQSLENALPLIKKDGLISVTCYRGHEGGEIETDGVNKYLSTLQSDKWSIYCHSPSNRPISPVLYTIYRNF